jgi:hypothetical protein
MPLTWAPVQGFQLFREKEKNNFAPVHAHSRPPKLYELDCDFNYHVHLPVHSPLKKYIVKKKL